MGRDLDIIDKNVVMIFILLYEYLLFVLCENKFNWFLFVLEVEMIFIYCIEVFDQMLFDFFYYLYESDFSLEEEYFVEQL